MEEKTNVATLPARQQPTELPPPAPSRSLVPTRDIFSSPELFEHAQRVARVFAASELVPPHMRNLPNCLIALQIANRLGEEPLTVMQNIYVVSGRPGWKTEYVIARANKAAVFSSRITWRTEGEGDSLKVTATATLAETGEEVSASCDMEMAKLEQWTRNPKYKSMPEHMLRWRSAAFLIRLYCPEVMIGIPTYEEVETMPPLRDVTPSPLTDKQRASLDEFAGVTTQPSQTGAELADELDESNGPGAGADTDGEAAKQVEREAAEKTEADKAAATAAAEREAAEKAKAEKAAAAEKKAAAAAKKKADEEAKAKVAAQTAAESESDLDEGDAGGKTDEAAGAPRNAEQYFDALKAHVDGATDAVALKAWFLSKEQKDLRGTCSVIGADLDKCKNYTLAKIGALTANKA